MPVDGVGGSTAAQLMYNRNDVAGTSEELTMIYRFLQADGSADAVSGSG